MDDALTRICALIDSYEGKDPFQCASAVSEAVLALLEEGASPESLSMFSPYLATHWDWLQDQIQLERGIAGPQMREGRDFWSNDNGLVDNYRARLQRLEAAAQKLPRYF